MGGHVGPLHKIQGYQGHRNVSKCSPHHNGDICTTRGNNLKTSFSYMSQNFIFLAIYGALRGLQWSDWAYLAFQLSSHPNLCACQIRKQSDKNFLSLSPKYEKKKLFFSYLGGSWGALMSNPGERKFQGSKTSSQSRHMYNNCQFFIYEPHYTKMCIFGYSGGPGWPINNWTRPILLPRHPLTYINLHIKYGSNPIRMF